VLPFTTGLFGLLLLGKSTQEDPAAPGILSFTEGDSHDSLPTQADGLAPTEWRCSGATQTDDDHPMETDIVHPTLTRLCSKDARIVKKDLPSVRPPLVDTLDYEPTPPEPEAVSSGEPTTPKKRKMDGDNGRKEHSSRAKRRIREEGAGEEEEEKKRGQRHSRAKRRPGDGDNQGERCDEEGPFGRLISLNDKLESVQVPATGLLMGRHSACHPLCRFSNNTYISTKHCRLPVVQEGSLRGDSQGRSYLQPTVR